MNDNDITHEIIGGAIEVHRVLGPGLLESDFARTRIAEPEGGKAEADTGSLQRRET
jgi:hypothetical protein